MGDLAVAGPEVEGLVLERGIGLDEAKREYGLDGEDQEQLSDGRNPEAAGRVGGLRGAGPRTAVRGDPDSLWR